MTPLFLKEKEKQEIRENVQISTLPFLKDETNLTKTKTLRVVTITMICSTWVLS